MPELSQPAEHRSTALTVDLDAVLHNAAALSRHAGSHPLLAVVKADAYGTGAVPVARALSEAGISWLGVALAEEGIQLRRAGLALPLLMLGPADPRQCPSLLEHGITPAVYSLAFLAALESAASARGLRTEAHLKVDSGMGRLGLRPEEIPALLAALAQSPHVAITGLFSNLASADDAGSPQTAEQLERFHDILRALQRGGVEPAWVHLANSSGLLAHPGTLLTLCRPGLTLYGMRPSDKLPDPGLEPALSFETQIAQIKDLPPKTPVGYAAAYRTERAQRVAILPIGYADGLPRSTSPGGHALVDGARCPFIGRISMDLAAIDLSAAPHAEEGSPVVLWGRAATGSLGPWDWARWAGTIPYEIMTHVGSRVTRRYLRNGREQIVVPLLHGVCRT